MMENKEIIYISVNNWHRGIDYPSNGFFVDNYSKECDGWLDLFTDEYCKANKLCVNDVPYDMSETLCISAPKEWVEKNCPEILDNEEYKKHFVYSKPGKDKNGCYILEYTDSNIGFHNIED